MGYIAIGQVGDEVPAITKSTTESYITVSQVMSQNWTFYIFKLTVEETQCQSQNLKNNDTKMFTQWIHILYLLYTKKYSIFKPHHDVSNKIYCFNKSLWDFIVYVTFPKT